MDRDISGCRGVNKWDLIAEKKIYARWLERVCSISLSFGWHITFGLFSQQWRLCWLSQTLKVSEFSRPFESELWFEFVLSRLLKNS
jgi:hypothetical protein